MKRLPGSSLLLSLFLAVGLQASGFLYDINLSRHEVRLFEPVTLRLNARQTDSTQVMDFQFTLEESPDYEARLLESHSNQALGHSETEATYLLFPKRVGKIDVNATLLVKRSSEEALREGFMGRDNMQILEGVQTENEKISIPSLALHVAPVPSQTVLIGDYSLSLTADRRTMTDTQTLYVMLELHGSGYPPPETLPVAFPPTVTVFADRPQKRVVWNPKGVEGRWIWRYALIGEDSFEVPPLRIQAFSPKRGQAYDLRAPPIAVTVNRTPEKRLVDQNHTPKYAAELVERWKNFGIGIVIFVAGFTTGTVWRRRQRDKIAKIAGCREAVQQAKSPRALLQVLFGCRFAGKEKIVEALESLIYSKAKGDFERIRKDLLRKL